LRRVSLGSTFKVHLDVRVVVLVNDGEGPVLHVSLDFGIIETTTDKTLGIEDSVPLERR
jgi:hypothetical protein